jgi:hypothetical protein
MKFIITENKVNEIILKQINIMYDADNIHWTPFIDDWGNELDYAIEFYEGDYDDGDNVKFRWYSSEFWMTDEMESIDSTDNLKKYIEESPSLVFENSNEYDFFQSAFDDRWKPIFIKWFDENFDFKVKTIHE